ncbi:hypothetical protein, partial [Roseovarius azorensis]|uniref:hypothetical protein n=1 Tax=Roseovarius azorensis TaxID=1287727 RepID=UPI001C312491
RASQTVTEKPKQPVRHTRQHQSAAGEALFTDRGLPLQPLFSPFVMFFSKSGISPENKGISEAFGKTAKRLRKIVVTPSRFRAPDIASSTGRAPSRGARHLSARANSPAQAR